MTLRPTTKWTPFGEVTFVPVRPCDIDVIGKRLGLTPEQMEEEKRHLMRQTEQALIDEMWRT